MGYIIEKGTGGGGGGDATAANQLLQLAQDATATNQQEQMLGFKSNNTTNCIKWTGPDAVNIQNQVQGFLLALTSPIYIISFVIIYDVASISYVGIMIYN